jgi:O-succinylbenzoate synthase
MRALYVPDVRHRLAAELRWTRHAPARDNKLARAVNPNADDRGHLVGEDRRQRRERDHA